MPIVVSRRAAKKRPATKWYGPQALKGLLVLSLIHAAATWSAALWLFVQLATGATSSIVLGPALGLLFLLSILAYLALTFALFAWYIALIAKSSRDPGDAFFRLWVLLILTPLNFPACWYCFASERPKRTPGITAVE